MAYEEKANEQAEGAEPDKDILEDARRYIKECVDEEEEQRAAMLDDLRFCALDQWPAEIRRDREADVENGARPCLTIDKINQYIVQVVNDMRQGKPGINVRPQDDAADVKTAQVLKGIVRNIEDQSNADIAYATAGENAAKIGLGYFRITTEYVSDDSFDQEIFIRPVPNTFSVYLSKHIMPDGSDAERGYVIESMPIETFRQKFPKAKYETEHFDDLNSSVAGYWRTKETITVVEEYCFKSEPVELLFLSDGTTISKEDYDAWPAKLEPKPGVQDRRTTYVKNLKWRKLTGCEVLDKRDLPGKYIPIVEVVGRETWVEGRRVMWGLVRPAKDSLRMYNYFASTITEKMGLAPKTPFIVAKGQIEGLEDKWKKANRTNFAYLEYNAIDVNGNAVPRPERQGAMPVEQALLHQMQVIEHDVQTSLGMFKAAVGETESQQSGRAILALQRESDTGTYHFGANLGVSIRHAGRIIVDLIPHYYDAKRVVRIIGEDGEVQTAHLDPTQDEAHRQVQGPGGLQSIYNPGVGKYDVSITVGPSYNTKRMEAAATFVELAKGADPVSAAILHYLTIKNSDFNGSEEASKMMKAILPAPVLKAISPEGGAPVPPEVQAQMQQMGQKMQMMAQEGQKLQAENQQLKTGAQTKMAQVQADREEAVARFQLDKENQDRAAQLAREKAQADFELQKWKAEQEAGLKMRQTSFEQKAREQDMQHQHMTKLAGDPNYKDVAMLPQVMEGLQAMTGSITDALGKLVELQAQTLTVAKASLAAFERPKSVAISDVRKNGDGTITGARIATTLN